MLTTALRSAIGRILPASLRPVPVVWPMVAEIDRDISTISRNKTNLYRLLHKAFSETEAQALTLKITNILLARFHRRNRSTHVTSRPYGLVIDPSNMCQLACPGCVHSTRNEQFRIFDWKPRTLAETRFSALLRIYGPWAAGAYLCNYGEPLLNRNTPKLVRLCKSYLMGTALSTSLSVRAFDAEGCVRSGLDFMNISIDGATQRTYEIYRRNGDIELVFNNIRNLIEARQSLNRKTPVMSWNFLAFEHNKHELPLAAAKARELGVDQFRVVSPFDVSWDDPSIQPARDVDGSLTRLNWFAGLRMAENWNPFPDSLESAIIARAFDEPLRLVARASVSPEPATAPVLIPPSMQPSGPRALPPPLPARISPTRQRSAHRQLTRRCRCGKGDGARRSRPAVADSVHREHLHRDPRARNAPHAPAGGRAVGSPPASQGLICPS